MSKQIHGNIVDIASKRIYSGVLHIDEGIIVDITQAPHQPDAPYLLPGLIDAHVHIESSMLPPTEFARVASPHGTVATLSDPHEIANVCGIKGIDFMLKSAALVPFKFYFGAPSCVPATSFETAGSEIGPEEIRTLFEEHGLKYLSEMMNYPGVLNEDPTVMEKLAIAKALGKNIDGHSPGLAGEEARRYIGAGCATDHECSTLEEALEKISFGMKILIREGSAAKNYQELHPLIQLHPDQVMFCSDDKHPDDLLVGHINQLVIRSLAEGHDLFDVLRCATLNPIQHYGLKVGLLQKGDPADFIIVDTIESFNILETWIDGTAIAKAGKTLLPYRPMQGVNKFDATVQAPQNFHVQAPENDEQLLVIKAINGEIFTEKELHTPSVSDGVVHPSVNDDVLKLVVVNRYKSAPPAVAFVKGFGLVRGALASSVAHDSHHIVAVGTTDDEIALAVNSIIYAQGGISAVDGETVNLLTLPIAGLMSQEEGKSVAKKYAKLSDRAKELGSPLDAPFMTLSFLCLLVIPSLKLGDQGLFDVESFSFTNLFQPAQIEVSISSNQPPFGRN